ncbi:MAG: MFS transporter [Myxococcales bacterium]|nr:MFS transporter [Myxococcales bacterium]
MKKKLNIGTKLGYGVGASAEASLNIAFNVFNLIFYNNVLGLSGKLCGLAVFIALVFDAVSDPLVGAVSDRWRSRLGRRHPFLYLSAVPYGLCFFLIYAPPGFLHGSQVALFLWLTILTVLLRTFQTFYHVPHLALGAELTTDYRERSVLMAYNSIFGMVGGVSATVLGFAYLGRGKDHVAEPGAYATLGIGFGIFAAVVILISAVSTVRRGAALSAVPDLPNFDVGEFVRDAKACLRNKNYQMQLLGLLMIGPFIGTRETLSTYLLRFFWEVPTAKIGRISLAVIPAFFIMFALAPRLHVRFSKRAVMLGGIALTVVAASGPITLRLLGVLPDNSDPLIYRILLLERFLFYLGFSSFVMSVMSALGDVADEHELDVGRRQEGMFYSARSFFGKVTQGGGHLLAGFAIDLIGFQPKAKVGEIPESVLIGLGIVDGPLAGAFGLAAMVLYGRYRIDRDRHARIRAELAARSAAKETQQGAHTAPAEEVRLEATPAEGPG